MLIALHKQARTTPHVRALIAASDEPVAVLAKMAGCDANSVPAGFRRALKKVTPDLPLDAPRPRRLPQGR